jgi:lysophospholipase L1-like esterase
MSAGKSRRSTKTKSAGRRKPTRKTARADRAWNAALASGSSQAQLIMERQARKPEALRRAGPPPGLLVAEGDSWFDYPFFDVLEELEDGFEYRVEAVAHRGDRVEGMAYDPTQLEGLWRLMQKLARDKREPKAILLSGGGNDIAGEEFSILLNHKRSNLPVLNEHILTGLFDERLRAALVTLTQAVTELSMAAFKTLIPIVMHGYDYPVPDGRGYIGGWWLLPGPWLEPGFRLKGYEQMAERIGVMETLIDRFNTTLQNVAGGPGLEHVTYLNLRGTLSNTWPRTYRKWWNDELHPTEAGFQAIARKFHDALSAM